MRNLRRVCYVLLMPPTARRAAVLALLPAAERFPDVPPTEPDLANLSPPDAALATAIHRTVLQRWLTLEHLLARQVKSPLRKLDPPTRAVLLAGAAQLIFFDRLPGYAVLDQSVRLAKSLANPRAAGLVNAVLRKLDGLVAERPDTDWQPAADHLPAADGTTLVLRDKLLPKPDNLLAHLVVATSLPLPLLQDWFNQFGRERATELARQSLAHPPTFVIEDEQPRPWAGTREQLADWLAVDPARRVQDPASLASVAAAAELDPLPRHILDLCAGRGTKTRQLAAQFPRATIVASDPHAERLEDLAQVGEAFDNVRVVPGAGNGPAAAGPFDLILLDVPCSNTGVLARRPGARYRGTPTHLASLVDLQRQIITDALPRLGPGGAVLYCTCSIDPRENQDQTRWLLERAPHLTIAAEATRLPQRGGTGGSGGPDYHDGSYHALLVPR
jgi:16S rRNA (cytosine967-C5)-methyltransferase